MPLISLTQETLDRGKRPEAGWSPAKLSNSSESKAEKGTSMNFFFEFVCTGGPEKKQINQGRYVTEFFNSAMLAMTEGSRGKAEDIQRFKVMVSALLGVHIDELQPEDFETEKWHGKECWIKIEILPNYQGKLQAQITDYSSYSEVPF